MLRESQRKMRYVRRMLPVEFDLWQYKSKEFWSMMLMLVLVFWLRLYMHYIGQWVLLQARSIPVTRFVLKNACRRNGQEGKSYK